MWHNLHLHLRMQVTLCLVTSPSMYLKRIKIWKVTGFIFEKWYGKFGKMYPCEKTADKYAYVISWFMVKIHFWGISRSRSTHFINNRGKLGPCSYALLSLKNRDSAVLHGQMAEVLNKETLKLRWRDWWLHHGNIPSSQQMPNPKQDWIYAAQRGMWDKE